MSENMNQSEGGMGMKGNPPPQFYDMLEKVKQKQAAELQEKQIASQKDPFADVLTPNVSAPEPETKPMPQKKPMMQEAKPVHRNNSQGFEDTKLKEILERLKQQSFVYYDVTLPSRGVFYNDSDGPKNGILHLRPMTGEEEQILANPTFSRGGNAINLIFERCVKENIKPKELLAVDRNCLLIWLRGISYGHEYEVDVTCPSCTKKFPHTILLNQLNVNLCPPELAPPLTDVMPRSGLKFSWHFPRGQDEHIVTAYKESRSKGFRDNATDDSAIYRLSLMIDEIEGLKDKTELMVILKKLTGEDVAYVRNLVSDPPFGVDTIIPMMCPLCYHEFEVDLPFNESFFSPQHRRKKETS